MSTILLTNAQRRALHILYDRRHLPPQSAWQLGEQIATLWKLEAWSLVTVTQDTPAVIHHPRYNLLWKISEKGIAEAPVLLAWKPSA